MTTRWVQYRVRPEAAAENAAQVRAVMDELAASAPPGLGYAAYVLEDGVTFVHVVDQEEGSSALRESPAFTRFVGTVEARCAALPVTRVLTLVGRYQPDLDR